MCHKSPIFQPCLRHVKRTVTQDILESILVVDGGGTCGTYNFYETTLTLVDCGEVFADIPSVCVGKNL